MRDDNTRASNAAKEGTQCQCVSKAKARGALVAVGACCHPSSRTPTRDPIKKPTPFEGGLFYWEPGSVLLSHGIPRTIIGAEAFHGPVRDGKAWDHLAMAARQTRNLYLETRN